MMLQRGDNDLVAGFQKRPTKAGSDEVDRFGRAAREDHAFVLGGVDELCNGSAGGFVSSRCILREPVNAAMNVGVLLGVETLDGIDNGLRLLRRCAVVEINQ